MATYASYGAIPRSTPAPSRRRRFGTITVLAFAALCLLALCGLIALSPQQSALESIIIVPARDFLTAVPSHLQDHLDFTASIPEIPDVPDPYKSDISHAPIAAQNFWKTHAARLIDHIKQLDKHAGNPGVMDTAAKAANDIEYHHADAMEQDIWDGNKVENGAAAAIAAEAHHEALLAAYDIKIPLAKTAFAEANVTMQTEKANFTACYKEKQAATKAEATAQSSVDTAQTAYDTAVADTASKKSAYDKAAAATAAQQAVVDGLANGDITALTNAQIELGILQAAEAPLKTAYDTAAATESSALTSLNSAKATLTAATTDLTAKKAVSLAAWRTFKAAKVARQAAAAKYNGLIASRAALSADVTRIGAEAATAAQLAATHAAWAYQ